MGWTASATEKFPIRPGCFENDPPKTKQQIANFSLQHQRAHRLVDLRKTFRCLRKLVSLRSSAILPLPPKGGERQNGRASFKKTNQTSLCRGFGGEPPGAHRCLQQLGGVPTDPGGELQPTSQGVAG